MQGAFFLRAPGSRGCCGKWNGWPEDAGGDRESVRNLRVQRRDGVLKCPQIFGCGERPRAQKVTCVFVCCVWMKPGAQVVPLAFALRRRDRSPRVNPVYRGRGPGSHLVWGLGVETGNLRLRECPCVAKCNPGLLRWLCKEERVMCLCLCVLPEGGPRDWQPGELGNDLSPLSKAACPPTAVGNKELAGALMDDTGEEGTGHLSFLFLSKGVPEEPWDSGLGQGKASRSLPGVGWS